MIDLIIITVIITSFVLGLVWYSTFVNTAYGMAEINASSQTTAMIFEALRSPDIVYEYNGWHIAKYLFKEERK